MVETSCEGCRERDARIAVLQQQVATLTDQLAKQSKRISELEERLGLNASNSSIPPSANPLQAPPPVRKKTSGRKPGGQPGHPAHLRQRLPAQRLSEPIVHYWPLTCDACQHALPESVGNNDLEPNWHQVVELPEFPLQVTEYQAHGCRCPDCGHVSWAKIPDAIRNHCCGPRLSATLSYLSGVLHASKRGIEAFAETVLQAPLSLGTVSNLEREMSEALASAHAEAQQAVQQASSKNVDETGWKQAGARRWLWGAATSRVVCFVIASTRGASGLTALLGRKVRGIISSDRWSVYGRLRVGRRQLCWAHLKRDFQKLIDRGGASKEYGDFGLAAVSSLFEAWYRFRGGGSREQLQAELRPLRQQVRVWLGRGASCAEGKTASFCRNLLAVEAALWTFMYQEDVEPTNNHIERLLRSGVLWRITPACNLLNNFVGSMITRP